jgi:hypothetical protein
MTAEETAIVTTEAGSYFLQPAAVLNTILQAYQAKKEFIEHVLREGVDFGKIPGADKPALLKPGAEKLTGFFGLSPTFEDVETIEDWMGTEHGGEPFFYYRQKCKLWRGERLVASGDGSCNSWEKKYRYRQGERTCPKCGSPAIKRSKFPPRGAPPDTEPGWYCFAKIGGCGAEFPASAPEIIGQQAGQVKNPDIPEQVNTVLKMAQKRALIAATLIATGASDYFTQDVEDFTEGEYTEAKVVKPAPAKINGAPDDAPPTPEAWEKWNHLTANAQAASIDAPTPPDGITTGELRKLYKELHDRMK